MAWGGVSGESAAAHEKCCAQKKGRGDSGYESESGA